MSMQFTPEQRAFAENVSRTIRQQYPHMIPEPAPVPTVPGMGILRPEFLPQQQAVTMPDFAAMRAQVTGNAAPIKVPLLPGVSGELPAAHAIPTTNVHMSPGKVVTTNTHSVPGVPVTTDAIPTVDAVTVTGTQVPPFQPGTEPFRAVPQPERRTRRLCDSFGCAEVPTLQAGPYYSNGSTSMLSLPGNFWESDFGRMVLSNIMNRVGGYAGLAAQQRAQMVNSVADMRNSVEWKNAWHRAREEGASAEAAVGIADNRIGSMNPDFVPAYATMLAPVGDNARRAYVAEADALGALVQDGGVGANARLTTGTMPGQVGGFSFTPEGTEIFLRNGANTEMTGYALPGVTPFGALAMTGMAGPLATANLSQLVGATNAATQQLAAASKQMGSNRDMIQLARLEADLAYKTQLLQLRVQQAQTQQERTQAQIALTEAQTELTKVRATRNKSGTSSTSDVPRGNLDTSNMPQVQ